MPSIRFSRDTRLARIAGWSTIIGIVVFWRLGYASLLDPDEAHYAELTREMIRARQWLVPLLNGQPFIDKPVLYHWLQAVSVWIFGESEFALRLPSACAAVTLFATVRWAGTQFTESKTGDRAAVMFATLPLSFALANVAVFDMVYSTFLFGGIACLLVAGLRERPRLQYVGWPLIALAVMTKGPVALLLVALLGVSLSLRQATRPIVGRLQWMGGLAFVALLASPWFVYMAFAFRGRFVRDYLLAGNLWYFTQPASFSTRQTDITFYVRTFVGAFFPWSFIAIGRGIDILRRDRRAPALSIEEQVLWIWTLLVVAFFTAARFKLDYYIFPAAPAACILASHAWTRATVDQSHANRWTTIAVVAVAIVVVLAGALLGAVLFQLDLGVPWTAAALPIVLSLGGIVLMWQIVRAGAVPQSVTVPAVMLLGVYTVVVAVGLPLLERSRPTAPVGRWVGRHSPAGAPVGVYGLDDWRGSIRYYTGRTVVALDDINDVQQFLIRNRGSYVLMLRRNYVDLSQSGLDGRVVGGRPAIVGRSGKYLRRQVWGRLVVVGNRDASALAYADLDADLPDKDDRSPQERAR